MGSTASRLCPGGTSNIRSCEFYYDRDKSE